MNQRVRIRTFHGALTGTALQIQVDQWRIQDGEGDRGSELSGYWNLCQGFKIDTQAPLFPNMEHARNYLLRKLAPNGPLLAVQAWVTPEHSLKQQYCVWVVGGRCRVPSPTVTLPEWGFALD